MSIDEEPIDVAGDVALEAAGDFAWRESFSGAALDVRLGAFVVALAHDHDGMDGAVGLSVASPVEAVSATLSG